MDVSTKVDNLDKVEAEVDVKEQVKVVGLRYITNTAKGITRHRKGDSYQYFNFDGSLIKDEKTIYRINKLIIPHVWNNVWICPSEKGHLQATGFDARNRKQYRYHKDWDKLRNERKFSKMQAFGQALPTIRQITATHLKARNLTKEKVLSTVVTILDENMIRIGNREYARTNKTYGLTTLRDKHVKNLGGKVELDFIGKKSIQKKVIITDKKLAATILKCKEIPGFDLFQYYDENHQPHPVGSEDVNNFLREITGKDITAKDYRTWGGSTIAIKALIECEPCEDEKSLKKNITETIKKVSGCLGNTPSVCKGYYIHPIIIEKYSAKQIVDFAEKHPSLEKDTEWFSKEERIFLQLLKDL